MGFGRNCYEEKQYSNDPNYCKKGVNPFDCRKLFFPEIDSQYFAVENFDVWEYNPIGYFKVNKQKATATFKINKGFFKEVKERFDDYKDCPIFPAKTFKEIEDKIKKHIAQIPEKISLKSKDVILNTVTDEQYIWVDKLKGWINIEEAKYYKQASKIYKNLNNLPDPILFITYIPLNPIYKNTYESNSRNRIDKVDIIFSTPLKNKFSSLKNGLIFIIRLIYFVFFGLWIGSLWFLISIFLMLTIIGFPIGKRMLKKTKFLMFLKK